MSNPEKTSQAPRIAIKFGAPSSAASKPGIPARKPGPAQPSSSLGKRSRPHALGGDSDSDDDDRTGRVEVVTSFGANGARNDSQPKDAKAASGPLVIACQSNRDWKAESKSKRAKTEALPHEREAQYNKQNKDTEPADQDKGIKWGLSITKKDDKEESEDSAAGPAEPPVKAPKDGDGVTEENATPDQEAMDALMGKDNGRKQKLVISSSNVTEADALKRDYQSVGEVATLEEYDQIPDGEFGMAMLRGMGFDGKDRGTRPKEVMRRPHLLGLGAKEDEEIKKAELAKKYGHRERRPRLDEYRREKEKEKQKRQRDNPDSYRNERDSDRKSHGHSHRSRGYDERDRNRDRDRDSHRHRDRDPRH